MYPTLSSSEKKDIIEDAINFSELNEFIDIPYNKYSKGMQSRLCLSLISARPGDLLVLDEVFDGADQFFKEKITKRVVSMIKSSGASFIVSHNPEHLRTTCNRLIVIDNKKIVFDGGIEEGINFYNQVR
jgi:ABC-type polysaccharide/polyol phosphate transport system ATPase subunit